MKRSHIAIFNLEAPTMMNPTFSTVSTLVRRGYRVTYVTSERYTSEISRLGAQVLPIEYDKDPFYHASRTLSLVAPVFEKNVPNLILYGHGAFAGAILAERFGTPGIHITPHLAFGEENIAGESPHNEFRQRFNDSRKVTGDYLRNHGVYQDAVYGGDVPTIYFYVRDLQLELHKSDKQRLYAGRCSAERPYYGSWQRKRDDRPAALLSSSTIYPQGLLYYRMCVDALAELQWHTILATGPNIEASSLDSLAPHCEIVQHMPQIALMPQVDLMICQGGMATAMEALYHGLPQIMLTQGYPELELYAENIEKHGLGVHLKNAEVTVDNIKRCVQIVEGAEVRNRVRWMQGTIKKSPGGEEVVNWIEEYLEGR